ncbi:TetR/AcrR family transcriptional regulator [Amorphoplanes digitatis]|uniref:AcrR family transcriptional regulator n=1 Tax=Actinoplanes digitatis TaxID=1868 RepID=A0A7W7I303_9ACTN|nr:TetR/AcrR family transcriptional regulator [Actinoplanes digitatis]MBB4765507.1 AcrR family transcriptional regulator [Actinoplanes digitatis]GID93600.1 TetR family transcriptional regulator [Actinoplanes digitatis]
MAAGAGVRRQRAAQTEAELKAAAVRVFARLGYLNTKITDITAEAGRAAGSFYTHFANKEALLEALLTDLLAQGDAAAADARHGDDFSDRDAVRYHVASYWYFHSEHRTLLGALQQAATVDESFAERARALVDPDIHHIAAHLVRAREAGLRLPGDPVVVATAFTTLMPAFAAMWQSGQGPALGRDLSDAEAIETLTSLFYAAIGGVNP